MQLTCPNCGEPVPAENINIQHLTAVCPSCSTVFQFNPPQAKIKRRKVKQPVRLQVREADDQLSLSFRTNFRLDKNERFIFSGIVSLAFTFFTVIAAGEYLAGEAPFAVALGFSLVALFLYFLVAVMVYNKTHIQINPESIQVSRKPLPDFRSQPLDIGLSGVERIRYAETPASVREGYDTPRYTVWAEMADGSRKVIVNDVIDDYAVFIAQRLNEYLDLDEQREVSHLTADEQNVDEEPLSDTFVQQPKTDRRQG